MTTFALVHGAWSGAWCWERLTPLLAHDGHSVIAVDLPCADPSASFVTYADVLCAALAGYDGDVVLVGHSLGANVIPLVAARRAVRHIVYLCGVIPAVGASVFDQVAQTDMMVPGWDAGLSARDAQGRTTWVDPERARALLCDDCDDLLAADAFHNLRAQADHPSSLPFSLREFPSVACTSVVCSDDRIVNPDWSRRIAHDRIGAQLVELPGSHSPFLSRPAPLAEVLLGLL